MRQLLIATAVVLGVGTTLAYAQEAGLIGAESPLELPVLEAFPNEAFVVTQEQTDRLAWAEERVWFGERLPGGTNERVTLAVQPTMTGGGGSRFGGPLVWALVVTAATTLSLFVLGQRLAPEQSIAPPDTQATAAGESPSAFRAPPVSMFTFGW